MIGMVKEEARAALKLQYWPIVGNELLASILVGGFGSFSLRFNRSALNNLRDLIGNDALFGQIMHILFGVIVTAGVIGLVYAFLVGNVIRVGIARIRLPLTAGKTSAPKICSSRSNSTADASARWRFIRCS